MLGANLGLLLYGEVSVMSKITANVTMGQTLECAVTTIERRTLLRQPKIIRRRFAIQIKPLLCDITNSRF